MISDEKRLPMLSMLRGWRTMDPTFTDKQGQYLAYIHCYTKINGRPPAEADMQHYFKVSPPSVHQMVVKLESLGLIERKPGVARSIKMLVDPDTIPPMK